MVTASHNPKRDDGYKLYWGNGVQIIPPHDSGTFSCILKNLAPWRDYSSEPIPVHSFEGDLNLRQHIQKLYMNELHEAFHAHNYAYPTSSRKIAYTAMHGVGREWVQVAFDRFGLSSQLSVVPPQADPDPEFPTVSFPNPEEKGVRL
jgi:phosphoglucomutase